MILEAYEAGHRDFGENKVQDLVKKFETLPKDIRWHFIGHLQTNKVKYIAPFIYLLHGVDSAKLLRTVQNEALKNKRSINVLLQIKIAEEESKFGMTASSLLELLASGMIQKELPNVNVIGLMGMSTNTSDQEQIKSEFLALKDIFGSVKKTYFKNKDDFKVLSMGMSGDYQLAVEAGSNMVRIGSAIFGERVY